MLMVLILYIQYECVRSVEQLSILDRIDLPSLMGISYNLALSVRYELLLGSHYSFVLRESDKFSPIEAVGVETILPTVRLCYYSLHLFSLILTNHRLIGRPPLAYRIVEYTFLLLSNDESA